MNYTLFNEDALVAMARLEPNSIDLVLTDPPYGTTQCSWDSVIPLEEMWRQLNRICKRNAAIVMFASQPFTSILITSNLRNFRYSKIWEKNKASRHLNAKKMPLKKFEDIVVFYNETPYYNPQMSQGHEPAKAAYRKTASEVYGSQKPSSYGGSTSRYPTDILEFPVVNNDNPQRCHPSQKPVALLEYLIRTYSKEGQTVLDFTCGSGSTGVACASLCRDFIGIDNGICLREGNQFHKTPWVDVARQRVEALLMQPRLLKLDL